MPDRQVVIPDIILERYLLNELPPVKMKEIEAQINTNSELKNRLSQIKTENTDFLLENPTEEMAQKIIHRYNMEKLEEAEESERSWGSFWKPALIATPVLALLVVLMIVNPFNTTNTDIPFTDPLEITRIKGYEPFLFVYKQDGGEIEMLQNGAIAQENDVLQISYVSANAPYGVIISVDGRGIVTRHVSSDSVVSSTLQSNGEQLLPQAYQLDDAPDFEAFFFVISLNPINIDEITEAAEELNPALIANGANEAYLNLPEDVYNQASFIIRKEDVQ